MTQSAVNNFYFDTSSLVKANHLIRKYVEFSLKGLVIEFKTACMDVFTITNNEDGTVDIQPAFTIIPELDVIEPKSGKGLKGLSLIIPEEGSPNKLPLFANKTKKRLFLPYRI